MISKFIKKALVLIGLFVVIIAGYSVVHYNSRAQAISREEKKLMGSATLPVVYSMIGSYQTNEMHGYTMEMNQADMRDNIIAIHSSRAIELVIDASGQQVANMTYEITDPETGRQVVSDDVIFWEEGGVLKGRAEVEEVESDKDYFFHMVMQTEEESEIHYYALLKYESNSDMVKQVEFIREFSDKLLNQEEALDYILPYIEPNPANANDNLGSVDITASFSQFTYQNLGIRRTTEPVIIVKDMTAQAGSYILKFQAQAENEYGVKETYDIEEFYRVCIRDGRIYLIKYNRTMNQVYDTKLANTSPNRMNLGILESTDVIYQASNSGKYISFVNEGSLYQMSIDDNRVTQVFSFTDEEDGDGIRDTYDSHAINLIHTEENGNMDFLVYGYMNRGEHEGKSGVVLYRYDAEKNEVNERVFIPSNRSYEVLGTVVGKLSTITEDNMLYIYLNDNIYTVDIEGKSYSETVSNVRRQDLAISNDGKLISWRDGTALRVLNLESGQTRKVEGSENVRLVPLGFVGEDFVYGAAKKQNVYNDKFGDETVLMSSVSIMDAQSKVVKKYKKSDRYILDADVSDTMVDMTLVKKVGTRVNSVGYQKTGKDQIVNNVEAESKGVSIGTITTERKEQEVVINYTRSVVSKDEVKFVKPQKNSTSADNALNMEQTVVEDGHYYVYGTGTLNSVCTSKARAKEAANDCKGYVSDGKGNRVYSYIETFK